MHTLIFFHIFILFKRAYSSGDLVSIPLESKKNSLLLFYLIVSGSLKNWSIVMKFEYFVEVCNTNNYCIVYNILEGYIKNFNIELISLCQNEQYS